MNKFLMSFAAKYTFLRHTPKGILLIALLLIGCILRAPVAVFGPIIPQLRIEYCVDSAQVGLLSGIPVLCYALFSPVASLLIAKRGLEKTFTISIITITFGVIVRTCAGFELMLIASVITGFGVALGNIAMPLIAARDFPNHYSFATGIVSATMNLSSVASIALTLPFTNLLGWKWAINLWIIVCLATLIIWYLYLARLKRGGSRVSQKLCKTKNNADDLNSDINSTDANAASNLSITHHKVSSNQTNIWKLSMTYFISILFVSQCFCYFSLTSWLPSILISTGMDEIMSGSASSVFQLFGVAGSITIGIFIKKLGHLKSYIIIVVCWITLPLGLLFLPQLWCIWFILSGWAQAATYIHMFSAIVEYSKRYVDNESVARKLSTITQTSAYAVAGFSPSLVGALHDLTHFWTVPIITLGGVIIIMSVSGILAHKQIK